MEVSPEVVAFVCGAVAGFSLCQILWLFCFEPAREVKLVKSILADIREGTWHEAGFYYYAEKDTMYKGKDDDQR